MTKQYQSFPGAAGDSRTLDKLKALKLPDLAGRSFLDVGCNEGFFCGFAGFLGAERVIGIDHGAAFVERARARFPGCEFLHQGWDTLPDGRFDVILLASALHYADDQLALIARLVDRLTPDGVLVLELGIVSSAEAEWVKVQRGIDERWFPTMPLLRKELDGYAWKWMGPSITQDGDPVKRHVLHISRRRPLAYLLMQPPGYGKSSIAKGLFPRARVKLVSGDKMLGQVARGERKAAPALDALVKRDHSPFHLDRTIDAIFAAGLVDDLVGLWLAAARGGDFAMDMYVPAAHQAAVGDALARAGYVPVTMRWDRPGADLLPQAELGERAEAFYLSMTEGAPAPAIAPAGFVDEVTLVAGRLEIRGWAIDAGGALPRSIRVAIDGRDRPVESCDRQLRPDVQAHLNLPHALFGYRLVLDGAGVADIAGLDGRLQVASGGDGSPLTVFRFSAPLAAAASARR